ncbi:MAG TPA: hypothetical protein VHL11_12450 [Phototrophicaceae bacterium]|jgi:hypothetical protein|nr:hypothetical protein [Phototrophicaceae bacterium]
MTVSIRWDNDDKTVILQELVGDVTVEDYLHLTQVTHAMLTSVSHTVHIIYDRTAADSVPAQMSKVFHHSNKYVTANIGVKIVVGAVLVTRINLQLCKVIAPALAKDVLFAETRFEARQMISGDIDHNARA